MSNVSGNNLVRMANDIAENLGHGAIDDAAAAEQVASHIRRFWARGMKAELKNCVSSNAHNLSAVAARAVTLL